MSINNSENKIVALICVRDFTQDFKEEWNRGFVPTLMKRGWVTWARERQWCDSDKNSSIHVEDNRFQINFTKDHFRKYSGGDGLGFIDFIKSL